MTGWRRWVLVGALVLCGGPRPAWAADVDVLLNKLVQKGILTASDAQEIREEVSKKTLPEWA